MRKENSEPINSDILKRLEESLETGVLPEENDDFQFNESAPRVAESLIGATITTPERTVTIIETKGYQEDEIVLKKTFQSAQNAEPGTLSGVTYRGKSILPNITVGDRGLVSPTAVTYHEGDKEVLITKASKIAEVLGVANNEVMKIQTLNKDLKQFTLIQEPAE